MNRGHIFTESWVICGNCQNTELINRNAGHMASDWLHTKMNYRYTKTHGWLCPECQESVKNAPKPTTEPTLFDT